MKERSGSHGGMLDRAGREADVDLAATGAVRNRWQHLQAGCILADAWSNCLVPKCILRVLAPLHPQRLDDRDKSIDHDERNKRKTCRQWT
jgi:hypothetical protein